MTPHVAQPRSAQLLRRRSLASVAVVLAICASASAAALWQATRVLAPPASAGESPASQPADHTKADAAVNPDTAAPTSAPQRDEAAPRAPEATPEDPIAQSTLARGIIGSKHDFTAGQVGKDLCLPCHTPHLTAAEAPLLTPGAGRQPVRPYQQSEGELSAASLLCLSCHDGVLAPDVYAGPHSMSWADRSSGGVSPGRNRLTSHPVGITYPLNDPDYAPPSAVEIDGRMLLPGGRMQCTTCHDPHNTQRIPGMLTRSNERSRMCLACHRL